MLSSQYRKSRQTVRHRSSPPFEGRRQASARQGTARRRSGPVEAPAESHDRAVPERPDSPVSCFPGFLIEPNGNHEIWFSRHFEVEIRAQSAIPNKLVEKTRGKSTKKWRKMALYGAFSRGKSAILPSCLPAALDCNTRVCKTLRPWSPAAARGVWSAKSAVRRHFLQFEAPNYM